MMKMLEATECQLFLDVCDPFSSSPVRARSLMPCPPRKIKDEGHHRDDRKAARERALRRDGLAA
jgi:hypothetical protein